MTNTNTQTATATAAMPHYHNYSAVGEYLGGSYKLSITGIEAYSPHYYAIAADEVQGWREDAVSDYYSTVATLLWEAVSEGVEPEAERGEPLTTINIDRYVSVNPAEEIPDWIRDYHKCALFNGYEPGEPYCRDAGEVAEWVDSFSNGYEPGAITEAFEELKSARAWSVTIWDEGVWLHADECPAAPEGMQTAYIADADGTRYYGQYGDNEDAPGRWVDDDGDEVDADTAEMLEEAVFAHNSYNRPNARNYTDVYIYRA